MLVRRSQGAKRLRPNSFGDGRDWNEEPTTAVITQSLEFKKNFEKAQDEAKKKGGAGWGFFEIDRAYLNSMLQNRPDGRIISMGRRSPAWPQGGISRSVKQYPDAFESRDARVPESRRAVPLSEKVNFNIMPGQVAFVVKGMQNRAIRTPQGDTTIVISTCVDGLSPEDELIFAGITRTANSVTNGDGTDNRSAIHVAGLETVNMQGWSNVHAFAPMIMVASPWVIPDPNGNGKPVPAIAVKGQPDNMFVPSLIELDERDVSIAQLRLRNELHQDEKFAALLNEDSADIGGGTYFVAITAAADKLPTITANKLKNFELFPRYCPGAAYLHWYGIRQLLIAFLTCNGGGNYSMFSSHIGTMITDTKFTHFFVTREDASMLEAFEGRLDVRGDGAIKAMAEQKNNGHRNDIMKRGGLLEFVDKQLDSVTHAWHRMIRQNYVGKALNWCNPGAELDILVGYGGL